MPGEAKISKSQSTRARRAKETLYAKLPRMSSLPDSKQVRSKGKINPCAATRSGGRRRLRTLPSARGLLEGQKVRWSAI